MKIFTLVNGTLANPMEGGAKWTRQLIEKWSIRDNVVLVNRGFSHPNIDRAETTFINFQPRLVSYLKFIAVCLRNARKSRARTDRLVYFPLTTLNWWQFFVVLAFSLLSSCRVEVVVFQAASISSLFRFFPLKVQYWVASRWSAGQFQKIGLSTRQLELFIPDIDPVQPKKLSNKINLFYLGKLSARRGAKVLYRVAAGFPEGSFVAVAPAENLTIQNQKVRLLKNITVFRRYLGNDEINRIFAKSDYFLFLPNSTLAFIDFPLSLIKAKKYDLKIIASDFPQLRELLRGYQKVNFIPIEEAPKMAKTIIDLLHSNEKS